MQKLQQQLQDIKDQVGFIQKLQQQLQDIKIR